jgi:XTP/dITP diphosphohydrolase
MKKVLIASNNEHKVKEIREILSKYNFDVLSLNEAHIDIEVEEDGATFMENAYKKASEIYNTCSDYMVIADDSGLMVDALGGAPGVYSARYAGEHGNSKKNNEKLLKELKGIPEKDRKAKFVCAIVFIIDKNTIIKAQGEANGIILEEERGDSGFGYDPLFYVPSYGKTFAELGPEIKNRISHRAEALIKLNDALRKMTWED